MVKKGFFFSTDAVIAVLIAMTALALVPTFTVEKVQQDQEVYFSSDFVQLLSTITLADLTNDSVVALLNQTSITELNRSILEQILRYTVDGNTDDAASLLNLTMGGLLPNTHSFGIWIEGYDDPIYTSSSDPMTQVISSKQMVSGIEVGKSVEGVSSRVFISGINERTSSSYAYFGGYMGDGNVTASLTLPASISQITNAYMELDAGSDFSLYVNDVFAGWYDATEDNITADNFTLNSSYLTAFQSNNNTIRFDFDDDTGLRRFIAGGLFRVSYNTDELGAYYDDGDYYYNFPGVEGIINLYDSFYVPGSILSMNLSLHLLTNSPTYISIGNTTIIEINASPSPQVIELDTNNFLEYFNYDWLSNKTVPLRVGLRNLTYAEGGASDAVLITDRTGSMDACDVSQTCGEPNHPDCSDCWERRDVVAQASDEIFINEMLSLDGNEVGLVGYGKRTSGVCSFHDLSDDNSSLQTRISDYLDDWCGYTCISCGIASATELLTENMALYSGAKISVSNDTEVHVGDTTTVSHTLTLDASINKSTFAKARLSVMGTSVDTDDGYQNCIFFNDHYLGRMCISNEIGESGWHTCSFPLKEEYFHSQIVGTQTWIHTDQADFEAGTAFNINTTSVPGSIEIASTNSQNVVLFSDDFDDNDISDYSTYSGNWYTTTLSGYGYILRQTSNTHVHIYQNPASMPESYIIKATIWNEDDDNGGIAFRLNTADVDNFYSCSANANNGFDAGIWRHDNDMQSTPTVALATNDWHYTRSRWYNVTVIVNETDNTIRCIWESEAGGVELDVTATDDDSWETGAYGIWLSWQDNFRGDLLELTEVSDGSASLLSSVFEIGATIEPDTVWWSDSNPDQTNITVDIRTGDVETPDSSWDNYDFSDTHYTQNSSITQAPGKYIQYRVNLRTDNDLVSPQLDEIRINYTADTSVNEVVITGANTAGCFETSGEQDDWDFKDVRLQAWEYDDIVEFTYFNDTEFSLGDGFETESHTLDLSFPYSHIKSGYLSYEVNNVDSRHYNCVFVNDHFIGRTDYQRWNDTNTWQEVLLDIPSMAFNDSSIEVVFTSGTRNTVTHPNDADEMGGCLRTAGDNDNHEYRNVNITIRYSDADNSYNRYSSMLVMSDGGANTKIGDCHNCDTSEADEEAVDKACEAHNKHGISIYSIAFGDGADETLMQEIADCDDPDNFYTAGDYDELLDIYRQIANEIIQLQFSAQVANVTGNVSSVLYPDSYLYANYVPPLDDSHYGLVPVTVESAAFNNTITQGKIEIPPGITVYEALICSYSGDLWTDYATINNSAYNETFFNLSEFGDSYQLLGDPYNVHIPSELIQTGNNTLTITTGLAPQNSSNGSVDTKAIYTAGIEIDINYTGVFAKAEGCNWQVEFEDLTSDTIPIPNSYSGADTCVYQQDTDCDTYAPEEVQADAINYAICLLFDQIDFDNDGKLFIKIGPSDLQVDIYSIGKIPFMWGPTTVDVRVWK